MGAAESQPAQNPQADSGGLLELAGLSSLDNYSQWWGAGIPGLSQDSGQDRGEGPPVSAQGVQEAYALVEEQDGARGRVRPRELIFNEPSRQLVQGSVASSELDCDEGQEDDQFDEVDEDEDEDEDAQEEEMSRLVGRDGYLLPYATNSFHMHKEAQLHRLHHEETGLNVDLTDEVRDNENVFFRAPRECPGWLPGGRYLGQDNQKEAIVELQAREQARARKVRYQIRKSIKRDEKRAQERKKRFDSAVILQDFNSAVVFVRAERAMMLENTHDVQKRSVVVPTWEAAMHESLEKLQHNTERYGKRKSRMTDKEKDLMQSRFLAIHEVMQYAPASVCITEALRHEGNPR